VDNAVGCADDQAVTLLLSAHPVAGNTNTHACTTISGPRFNVAVGCTDDQVVTLLSNVAEFLV